MVWILQLVSEYKTMRADGDLRVVLRWLGGGAGRQASATYKHSRIQLWGSLPLNPIELQPPVMIVSHRQ